jgi:superfamily II DNA helicase RecQ
MAAALPTQQDLDDSIKYAASKLQITDVKENQKVALTSFLKGHDVIVVLPTGMGKSFILKAARCVGIF